MDLVLNDDVLTEVMCTMDVHSLLALSQTNKYLNALSGLKVVWYRIISELVARSLVTVPLNVVLQELSTAQLRNLLQRTLAGPATWHSSHRTAAQITYRTTLSNIAIPKHLLCIRLLPGGRFVFIADRKAMNIYQIESQGLVWSHPQFDPAYKIFHFDVQDEHTLSLLLCSEFLPGIPAKSSIHVLHIELTRKNRKSDILFELHTFNREESDPRHPRRQLLLIISLNDLRDHWRKFDGKMIEFVDCIDIFNQTFDSNTISAARLAIDETLNFDQKRQLAIAESVVQAQTFKITLYASDYVPLHTLRTSGRKTRNPQIQGTARIHSFELSVTQDIVTQLHHISSRHVAVNAEGKVFFASAFLDKNYEVDVVRRGGVIALEADNEMQRVMCLTYYN
ncbi:hypothetical protein C8R47DRAFT_1208164 [Mycena vitilis]|nr:hypothetical protein C8R47DRAFT_1208164 [Mycena vitilis]